MKENGLVYVLLVVLMLMGAVIVVQQREIQQIENLPICNYSTVITVQGQGHEGYYVGLDSDHKKVCAQSLIKEGTVIDFGL